MEEKKCETTKK